MARLTPLGLLCLAALAATGCADDGAPTEPPVDAALADRGPALDCRPPCLDPLRPLEPESLRAHVGEAETVDLTVYVVGFPPALRDDLEAAVRARLERVRIKDTKPWWLPRIPLFGRADFDLVPAPADLPPELVPPDGMIRYEGRSMIRQSDPLTGQTWWQARHDIPEAVDDWHQNVDVVHYVEHDGAYTDVAWRIGALDFEHRPASDLDGLIRQLQSTARPYRSASPAQTFELFSYNTLMDALDESPRFEARRGGASLVLLNLDGLSDQAYSFYADPSRDLVPLAAQGPIEVQYPAVSASTPRYQAAADALNTVLGGGLSQAKMFAALEVVCRRTQPAGEAAAQVPGMRSTQSLCAAWALEPIPNLLGNQGRRFFVSDATRPLAGLAAGSLEADAAIAQVADNAWELFRYGVLQTSIKANNRFSEAYELRVMSLDLRFDAVDTCILDALEHARSPEPCLDSAEGHASEITYALSDVFDADLATRALAEFAPGHWQVTVVPFPFGQQPDGTIDRVEGAQAKAELRDFLDEPVFHDPDTGAAFTLTHPPLYRELLFSNPDGTFTTLTSSWERGIDPDLSQALLTNDVVDGGLGIYRQVWPDAVVKDDPPYHRSGRPSVKPLTLILTPAPDGPRGERWGTFPFNITQTSEALTSVWGGGGWWSSTNGNEQGGALLRRDFFLLAPQYILGKHRGNGASPMAVMPDGSVRASGLDTLTRRALEIGTIHWVDQFDDPDPAVRQLARDFVRETTTLQGIETLQHGLGYMHAPEPRQRFHYDGQRSTLARMYGLLQNPDDVVGALLHQYVNQYTTHGVSTVWGQNASEWNSVAPQTGMQLTLFRSHAREAIDAVDTQLRAALALADGQRPVADEVAATLEAARAARQRAIEAYDAWAYHAAITASTDALHTLSGAFAALGQPGALFDPTAVQPLEPRRAAGFDGRLSTTRAALRAVVQRAGAQAQPVRAR